MSKHGLVIDEAILDAIGLYDERFPYADEDRRAADLSLLIKGLSKYGMPYVRGVIDGWWEGD